MTELRKPTEAVGEYILRSVDVDRDAEKLARMWIASDDQWPGTWSSGVPITAERLRSWLTREKSIDTLVWDTGDAIAGYCSLWQRLDEPNVTYIALLNVAPEFQKKSLARKFLTHCVERVVELGSVRLDLGTWSGNLKAVPLYKKCGFFWMPGTSVHMFNFMPTILTMACARRFFARHDWYRSFKRELSQSEDDERWEGMKVFTYRFAEDGDALTVRVDRESRTITAVDTDQFFAAAIVDDLEPARGLPTGMRWKVTNKRDRPMQVALIATGTEHIKLDHRAALYLEPGETAELAALVRVAPDAPEVEHDRPALFVRSLLIVDEEVLELGTGLRPRAAVEVSIYPDYVTLLPGVPQVVELRLRSHLARGVDATVSIAPQPGLAADWTQRTLSLAPEGFGGGSLGLTAATSGVFEVPVSIVAELDGETLHIPARPVVVFALPLGGVLGAQVDGMLRVENETVRLIMAERGAELTIRDPATDAWLGFHAGYAAPPMMPSEYRDGKFTLNIERHADRVVAVAAMASRENPDFVLRKLVTVSAGPVFTVDYEFENLGVEVRRFQLVQRVGGNSEKGTLTVPFRAGLGRGSWAEFPGQADDESRKAAAYAEAWTAVEYGPTTLGMVWASDVEEIDFSWAIELLTRFHECAPQSRVRPGSLHFYLGDGDWRTVRRLWRRLAGQGNGRASALAEPSASLTARVEPPVVVADGGEAAATLVVENLLSRKLSGTATLALPDGWQAEPSEFDLPDMYRGHPFRADLRLMVVGHPGPARGTIALRSAELDADFPVPLIRLGDGRTVDLRQENRDGQSILTIDNGRLAIAITPDFGGSVSAIREGTVNHLLSAFPRVGQLGWLAPWYGGLTPVLLVPDEWDYPGKLRQEVFEAEAASSRDGQGIEWRGVRQRVLLSHARLRGLTLEIDTLTVGGSPVVKQVMRLINPTPASRRLETFGWIAFVQPDGSSRRTTLWGPEARKPSDRLFSIFTGDWAAAQNPDTGRAIVLVSPGRDAAIDSWGRDGGHLQLLAQLTVPAGASVEVAGYLALADDVEAARHFVALKDLA